MVNGDENRPNSQTHKPTNPQIHNPTNLQTHKSIKKIGQEEIREGNYNVHFASQELWDGLQLSLEGVASANLSC